jgi:uncharacterized protein YkwD
VRVLVAAVIAAAVIASAAPALLSSSALGATALCTPDASWPAPNASFASQVVTLINQHRATLGLSQLTVDANLTDSGVWKARHMAQFGYFDHADPAPPIARDPFTRISQCGYTASGVVGENIAKGQSSPSEVVAAWLASPGHRQNIEDPAFQATGVGVAAGADGALLWVQDFAGVSVGGGAPAPPPPAPAPPPAAPPPGPPAPPPAAPVSPPKSPSSPSAPVSPAAAAPPAVVASSAAVTPQIGSAVTPASQPVAGRREHRRTHLVVGKPQPGAAYAVRMSFGRVPIATGTLAVRCRAKLSGKRMRGAGEITGHAATCTWSIPAGASGKRLVVIVKVSGRHGVMLVRRAHLIVG